MVHRLPIFAQSLRLYSNTRLRIPRSGNQNDERVRPKVGQEGDLPGQPTEHRERGEEDQEQSASNPRLQPHCTPYFNVPL